MDLFLVTIIATIFIDKLLSFDGFGVIRGKVLFWNRTYISNFMGSSMDCGPSYYTIRQYNWYFGRFHELGYNTYDNGHRF
jgi:hypothetical protein